MNLFKVKIGVSEILLIIILILIYYNLTYNIQTDIPAHARNLRHYLSDRGPFRVNFLYYFTIYLFSFFSSEKLVLLIVSVYVLTAATFFKYIVVKRIIYSKFQNIIITPLLITH